MPSAGDINVRTLRQLDRLVSASSSSDALESIQILTSSLDEIFKSDEEDKQESLLSFISTCYENEEFMSSLCSLLSDGTMRSASSNGASMTVDDGDSAACSFLSTVLVSLDLKPNDQIKKKSGEITIKSFNQERQKHLKKMLSCPNDGAVVHALVDLLSPGHHDSSIDSSASLSRRHNLYAQTQALKILSSLISILPTLIHSQILSAPDGLNRILDLLHNSTTEESIRNEAILLCTSMAKTNSGCARLMIFGEAYEKVLQIAESEISHDDQAAGVSSASIQVIVDCFNLAIELTKQDEMGSEVFLGNKSLVKILVKFLDLRTGEKFLYPELAGGTIGSHEDEADDLDDILNNGKKTNANDGIDQSPAKIPYLTEYESKAARSALELLRVLIVGDESILKGDSDDLEMKLLYEKKRSRQHTILSYDVLSRLVIDMALYTLPPPDSPASVYVSAVPLHEDQLKALDVFAAISLDCGDELQQTILNKQGIYLHAGVLDRLMYLVCTGDGANRPSKDADEISMYALGVLRCLLSAKQASIMVMHSIAPPIDDQEPEAPPVFQKLVNTLAENLYCLTDSSGVKDFDRREIDRINRMVKGAAGALGIFLTNGAGDTTREMLLRVPVPPPPKVDENTSMDSQRTPLIDSMLAYLEQSLDNSTASRKSNDVLSSLLRLFVEWIPSAPHVIAAIFSASSSISLSILLQKKLERGKPPINQSLSALFLGLCLEYMDPEEEIGGWTRASIINMISNRMGIRKFTQVLESLKIPLLSNDSDAVPPWTCSPAERTYFLNWYTEIVSVVRKRTVQELTQIANDNDDSDSEDVDQNNKDFSTKDQKNIYKLVSEQNLEIESLRKKLADSENTQKLQSAKLKILQKRLEANPSQLDDMLNELTIKNTELEAQNRHLQDETTSLKTKYEKEIQSKTDEIITIQQNVNNLENEKEEILEERCSIQKELEGLSSAYSNLEQEYNRISSNGSIQEEIITISTYRKVEEENLKLKHDVHAANEWMRKAVQKMDDLKKRNQSLELELNDSKSAHMQLDNAMGSEIESASVQLASQSAQMEILSAERDRLSLQIEEVTLKLTEAESEIISLRSLSKDQNAIGDAILSELNDKVKNLENELEKRETAFEDTLRKLRESLISKDGKIVELEQKLALSELDENRNTEIHRLKDEVKKLTDVNKEAQEWMSNAVKRHTGLKKQLEDAKLKIDDLEKDSHANSDAVTLQERLDLISLERDNASQRLKELEPLKDELEILRSDYSVKLQELKEEKDSLEITISEKSELISDLQSKLFQNTNMKSESEENESTLTHIDDLQRLRDENEILTAERLEHLVAIEDMKVRLTEFQSWTETAQNRIDDLEAEKECIEKELLDMKSKTAEDYVQDDDLRVKLATQKKAVNANEMSDSSKKDEADASPQSSSSSNFQLLLEDEKQHLKDKISELETELSSLRVCMEEKDAQLNTMREEIENSQSKNDGYNNEIDALQVNIHDLEIKNQDLLTENASLKKTCSDLRMELDDRHDVKKMLSNKETEIRDLRAEVEESRAMISTLRNEYETEQMHSNDKIKDLEFEIGKLHATIQNQEHETETAISEWESRVQDLEGEIVILKSDKNAEQDALAVISEWERRCSELEEEINRLVSEQNLSRQEELEHEIEELNSTIALLQNEANDAISKWEERSSEMEDEIQRLSMECSEMEDLRQQIQTNDSLIKELMNNVDVERENVLIVQKEKDDAETVYRTHIEDLDRAIVSHEQENLFLQSQLDERDDLVERTNQQVLDLSKELNDIRTQSEEVVKEWQENSNQQEETISVLRRTIESQNEEAVVAIQQWESRCDTLHKKIEELESELEDYETNDIIVTLKNQLDNRTEEARKLKLAFDDKVIKEQKLLEDLRDLQQSCANLQHIRDERDNLLSGRRSMEDEIERLRSAISELERTHQDQNKLIQAMKETQVSDNSALKKEREDNMLLKEELKRLGDDFALLLGANEQDPFGFNVEKITSRAAINIMEKERIEINALRSSLGKLQEELNNSRLEERDAHVKVSETLQLLASSEKQNSTAKAEIEILLDKLESENRVHIQQRSDFEQRIRHLEKDFQELNSTYTKDMEKLMDELTSIKAERDSLIYALEESESINSTLVHHTSLPENAGTYNLETEVSKLHAEKAQLLMMVSKQCSSVEKRIRGAVSGDLSDTVSKSEFTSLRAQFEQVATEYEKAKNRNDELLSFVQNTEKLGYEKERLEHEVAVLIEEKSLVESSFTQKLSSYQDKYSELEKRYNEAEAKLRELQHVQKSHGKGSFTMNDDKVNSIDSDSSNQSYIEELKTELKQSKSLYQDLWTEHEDLLALLAQQDCEKRCLEEALVKSEGHEALHRVMASAQEKLQNELSLM